MGKFVSGTSLMSAVISSMLLASCGSSSSTRVTANQVPAVVSITPAPDVSLELGQTQAFTPAATNSAGAALTENFTFQSSNPSVVTIATNGQACAGTWDSLTVPAVCTPGATGIAQVTAQANGVISSAVNVYVHQHIANIVVSKLPTQPPTLSPLCLTKDAPQLGPGPESQIYQVFAYNVTPSGSTDITSTVGPFTWQAVALPGQTSASASVSLTAGPANSPQCLQGLQGQCFNEEVATAATPGSTEFIASAGGANSQPVPFTTCPVQSIKITPANGSSNTSFVVNTGTSTPLNAVAYDILSPLSSPLTGVPLTWSANTPTSVSVSGAASTVYSSVGTVGSPAAGGGSVTVSCTPPTCNGGIIPSMPIYSSQGFDFTVKSSSAPASPTVYTTTSACTTTTQNCTSRLVPITKASSTTGFTAGSGGTFPFAPNSVKYDLHGSNAFFGVNSTSFGTQGLMAFNGSAVSQLTSAAGKVLAVSPDGATVILSDTVDAPARIFVCTSCNTSSRSATPFLLPNAVAASFSPDGLKAYIVSGSSCPGTASAGCLMIYSKLDAPQFVQLNTPATDVAFIGNGELGYITGPAGSSALATCDHPSPSGPLTPVALNAELLRPLPDGQSAIALAPPNIQTVTWPSPALPPSGCVSPRGTLFPLGNLDISTTTLGAPVNLGVGSFTPTQFLVSSDGTMAYILGQVQQSVNFPVTSATCALNSSGVCATPYTTYSYMWTSGPTVAVGMNINVSGMPAGDNGTFTVIGSSGPNPAGVGTFTVANPSSVPAPVQSGSASGIETLNFDFVVAFNIQAQTTSNISLVGSATPLSASLSPSGDLLFVGADDNQVHVISTASQLDTQQVPLTFPQSSLCVGPGSPATSLQTLANVTSASQDSTTGITTFSYSLTQGPPLAVGNAVRVTGMTDQGNNGTFVVTTAAMGSFTAVNPIGVTATSQGGSGFAGLACNPDLIVVKP